MMLIAFTIYFGMHKLANDRKDRNIVTTDCCLRISAGNATRRNNNGSCV